MKYEFNKLEDLKNGRSTSWINHCVSGDVCVVYDIRINPPRRLAWGVDCDMAKKRKAKKRKPIADEPQAFRRYGISSIVPVGRYGISTIVPEILDNMGVLNESHDFEAIRRAGCVLQIYFKCRSNGYPRMDEQEFLSLVKDALEGRVSESEANVEMTKFFIESVKR